MVSCSVARSIDYWVTWFQMLIDWLSFLDQEDEIKSTRAVFLLGGFLLRLLTRLGYKIELTHCLDCKQEILPLAYRWHSGHGGLVCVDCIEEKKQEWFAARAVSEEAIKLIRFARDRNYDDLLRLNLIGAQVEEFAQIVHDLVMFHLPGDFETPFWSGILVDYKLEVALDPV